MKDTFKRSLSSTPLLIVYFLIVSFIVVIIIPGNINTIVSDWVGVEGSGMIVNYIAFFLVLIIAYYLISLAQARRDEVKLKVKKEATSGFQIIGGNRLERETEKVEKVYKPLKKYLVEDYIKQLDQYFLGKDLAIVEMTVKHDPTVIRLIHILSDYRKESLLLPDNNPEDKRLMGDLSDFHNSNIQSIYGYYQTLDANEHLVRNKIYELYEDDIFKEIISKVESKIHDPTSSYGQIEKDEDRVSVK